VENLPKDTTHDSLAAKFAEFGPVAYVSIPKFKNSSRIKGFAFIEFESKDTVRKVLDSYATPSEIAPASLLRKETIIKLCF
jgi:La-related protein 7